MVRGSLARWYAVGIVIALSGCGGALAPTDVHSPSDTTRLPDGASDATPDSSDQTADVAADRVDLTDSAIDRSTDDGGPFVEPEPASGEFVGPFATWADVRRDYGAVGDGVADDTAALQRALTELGQPMGAQVLFVPAGRYRITATLQMIEKFGVGLVGEDPA